MLEETNTGVTTGESATPAASDSGSPVVPQTTDGAAVDSTGEQQIESPAPPAADAIPENDDDLANLSETERTPLLNQRARLRELNKWRTGAEPVMSWVEQRGGIDNLRSDAEMVDKLFSPNIEERKQFYASLHSQ